MSAAKSVREQFKRTTCGCAGCRVGCKTMPGSCAVGDVERIADELQQPVEKVLDEKFQLSTACKVGVRAVDGIKIITVPTITPAQKPDGSCIFLAADGQCTIHKVSPFGCSHHDVHMSNAVGKPRSEAMIREIMEDGRNRGPYWQHCGSLAEAGRIVQNPERRRQNFERALRLVQQGAMA